MLMVMKIHGNSPGLLIVFAPKGGDGEGMGARGKPPGAKGCVR